jgi:acetolactate synthase-1/2/3 large subunit
MSDLVRLAEEIVERTSGPVFGVPGSGATLTLIDALEQRGREFVLTHFEGAAAMMAGTVGCLSGQAGVCVSIKGPGLTNMVPGLAVSTYEAFPLVAIAEAYGAAAPAAKVHKRIDQAALTGTVSKAITQWAKQGPSFADIAALAEAETPGPVVLELAQPEPATARALPQPVGIAIGTGAADVAMLVEKSKRPVVIAGTLAVRADLSEKLNRLAIPVFSTTAAKGVMDETHPLSAGVYTGVGLDFSPEHDLFKDADLVVCIGMRPHEVLATRPFGIPAVNFAAVSEPGAEAFDFAAIAESAAASEILDLLAQKSWGAEHVSEAQNRIRRAAITNRFLPGQVYQHAQKYFAGNIRGVFDTGYFCTIAEHVWQASNSANCLMSGQGRYMGTGIPMALGAAIYDPSMPTIAFLGDGGIGPFIGEAKIAVERRLPLLFCLLTDGYFASIRTRALQDSLTQRPVTIVRKSWRSIFEGFGMPTFSSDDETSFDDTLRAWQPSQGPAYIEIGFEPEAYEAMVKGIR